MEIRRLTEQDAHALWQLRLTALETEPNSFGESAEELRKTTVEEYAARLRSGGAESFVFGAFDGHNLVGMTGFYREQGLKRKHIGRIWGVFVLASARGRGAGRALLSRTIEPARALSGLNCILLSVATTQVAARQLYASLGFVPFGLQQRALKIGDLYVDEELMFLDLSDPPV